MKKLKKVLALLLLAALLSALLLPLSSCGEPTEKLYLYNWGEYMPLGTDGSENVLELFEAYYEETYGKKIEVVYSIFSSNEEMYAKLQNGSSKIDLVIPSDYMVERLIAEDRLAPLHYENIPHYDNIAEEYRDFYYDRGGLYSIPYTVSYVGLIYDVSIEDEITDENGDISWRCLWDPRFAGRILNFNNSRDAFGIAQYILSYENGCTTPEDNYVNTTDPARWDAALELLQEQKPLVQAYVMDEVFNKMESGAAVLAPYYVGDFYTMQEENEDLRFAYPKEGTNCFGDALCIPKNAQNQTAAERFIDFTLMTDAVIDGESYNIAKEIAEYICYGTPNRAVLEDEEYEFFEDELLYPEEDAFTSYFFHNLDPDTLNYQNSLWEQLKIESSGDLAIYITAGSIVGVLVAVSVLLYVRRKKREKFY